MDWNNVNLSDGYERDQSIVDALSFDTPLLEVHCNIKDSEINVATVTAQFEEDLQNRITSAREIFEKNVKNIVKEAIAYNKRTA